MMQPLMMRPRRRFCGRATSGKSEARGDLGPEPPIALRRIFLSWCGPRAVKVADRIRQRKANVWMTRRHLVCL